MKFSIAAIGAVTLGLGSGVMSQYPGPAVVGDGVPQVHEAAYIDSIPILEEFKGIEGQWKFDACHKVDSAVNGLIWPCASQLRTLVKLCPSASTVEERFAQRDCLCAAPSSFWSDALACSECKIQNGLQPVEQRDYWFRYYGRIQSQYCGSEDVPMSYEQYIADLNGRLSDPPVGQSFNSYVGTVVDPAEYYTSAGVGIPDVQGAGMFTPASSQVNNDTTVAVTDPLAGQVRMPVMIAVENLPNANGTNTPSTGSVSSSPSQQSTASVQSTFTTSPRMNLTSSTSSSLLPATTTAPVPGSVNGPVEEHVIIIDGRPTVVFVMWIVIDCSPKNVAGDSFAINFNIVGVDDKQPVRKVDNSAQFDMIKDVMPDAGKDNGLAEVCKARVSTEAPVVVVPANNAVPLPPKASTAASYVSFPDNNPDTAAGQPDENEEYCVPDGEVPEVTVTKPTAVTSTQMSGNDCHCEATSAKHFSRNVDGTKVCAEKRKIENDCNELQGEEVRKCMCSEEGFRGRDFFHEAVACARSSPDIANAEFEAQVLFKAKSLYCEEKQIEKYQDALQVVEQKWRATRAPASAQV